MTYSGFPLSHPVNLLQRTLKKILTFSLIYSLTPILTMAETLESKPETKENTARKYLSELHSQTHTKTHQPNQIVRLPETPDLLYLSDEVKVILDEKIKPIRDQYKRTEALHFLMFSPENWKISYNQFKTLSAQDTYIQREGNCLSLSTLFIAAARHVGLRARFQQVNISPTWQKMDNYFLVPGHINALVYIPKERIHVEFLRTFFETEFELENTKVLNDKQAMAEYHNNISVEHFIEKRYPQAIAHAQKSISIQPDLDFLWSNMGVIQKFTGNTIAAEKSYRQAIKLNKRNFSALTNLYIILSEKNKTIEAEKIAKQVVKYSKKNPYYLAKLAQTNLQQKQAKTALKHLNKAIKINNKVALFYHLKAQAYSQLGKHEKVKSALIAAKNLALEKDEISRYSEKLNTFLAMQKASS